MTLYVCTSLCVWYGATGYSGGGAGEIPTQEEPSGPGATPRVSDAPTVHE